MRREEFEGKLDCLVDDSCNDNLYDAILAHDAEQRGEIERLRAVEAAAKEVFIDTIIKTGVGVNIGGIVSLEKLDNLKSALEADNGKG